MSFITSIISYWKNVALTIILCALLAIVFLENRREVDLIRRKLLNVSSEYEELKKTHASLLAEKNNDLLQNNEPSEAYERIRRNMYTNVKDLWHFMKEHSESDFISIEVMDEVRQKKLSLLSDMELLQDQDGWNKWRQHRADKVSDVTQRRLYQLQNPVNCKEAKKLGCSYSKSCDFGCQLHHIAYCISFAYATGRTLIINPHQVERWETMFHPISDSCTSAFDDTVVELSLPTAESSTTDHPWHINAKFQWAAPESDARIERYIIKYKKESDTQWKMGTSVEGHQQFAVQNGLLPGHKYEFTVSAQNMAGTSNPSAVFTFNANYAHKIVALPLKSSNMQERHFLPLEVPIDLVQKAKRFNGDPPSWWVGQVLKYILKPRGDMQATINRIIKALNFTTPIVGIHMPRGEDTESEYHEIEEYMDKVDEYYDKLELSQTIDTRRVYLVSDDVQRLDNARQLYPSYEFLGVPKTSKEMTEESNFVLMAEELVDIHMLAKCDFIVCAFSSQMGRIAYEMMQANRVDASNSFFSIDNNYYFGNTDISD